MILLLRSMGGSIHLQGRSHVIVQGRPFLHGATAAIMPDRIEALTWIVYATMAEGHVLIEDVPFGDMEIPLLHLQFAGVDFFRNRNSVLVLDREPIATPLQPFEAACGTHPGIISDMQPFYVLLALKAVGRSLIVDYRYPDRTAYLKELERFAPGAIQWEPGRIRVHGPAKLRAAAAVSTDLRGSMAVLLAALLADGTSRVDGVEMALRGYNALEAKLAALNIQAEFEP